MAVELVVAESSSVEISSAEEKKETSIKKILIVEDNQVNRMVAEKILRNMRFEPICVESGRECIDAVKSDQFDLIFMDCHMPDMDGFETTQVIRQYEQRHASKAVPIVALTANTSAEIRQECLTSGMSDYVAKPIKMAVLQDVINRWL